MGALTSRPNEAVEETDVGSNHLYRYPPKMGKYVQLVSIESFTIFFKRKLFWKSFHNGRGTFRHSSTRVLFIWRELRLKFPGIPTNICE